MYLFSTSYPDKFKGSYNYMGNMVYRITSNPRKDRNPSCAHRLDCLRVLRPSKFKAKLIVLLDKNNFDIVLMFTFIFYPS